MHKVLELITKNINFMKIIQKFLAVVVALAAAVGVHAATTSSVTLVGDVNVDGSVNAADVTALYNYILNGDQAYLATSDVNEDDAVNAGDVTAVYNIILGNVPEVMKFTVNGVSFKMVKVAGGTFMMGAGDEDTEAYDEERPAHQVTLSDYWIGETEVTEGLWIAVMNEIPVFSIDDNYPVRRYDNAACAAFANALSQITGKNFTLPTEAQWEFAARGGNHSHGYRYAGSNNIDEVGWYAGNSGGTTVYNVHEVATKAPNELGLYDMCGNLAEWVSDDTYYYTAEPQVNPTHPQADGSHNNVARDGCWIDDARDCRVTMRSLTSGSSVWIGFRLAIQPQ